MKKQCGAALVVSLLLLLVTTLVGITSVRMITLEEKMSGNSRDQQLAFQAAEAALRQGEAYVKETANLSVTIWSTRATAGAGSNVCTNGLCTRREDDPKYIADVADSKIDAAPCSANFVDERWVTNSCVNNPQVWTNTGRHRNYVGTFTGVSAQPMYIVELLGCYEYCAVCTPQVSKKDCVADHRDYELYRITALGTGGSAAKAMLQTTYRKSM